MTRPFDPFRLTIKESCLKRMILFGETGLRRAIREFVEHYPRERNHQGLESRLIIQDRTRERNRGPVRCRRLP